MRGLHRKLSYRPASIAVKQKRFADETAGTASTPFDARRFREVPRIHSPANRPTSFGSIEPEILLGQRLPENYILCNFPELMSKT
jgi:hypothetical protein